MFVRLGRTIESIQGDERVEGVVLDDGEHLPADLIVVACGIRPRVEVARNSKIPVNKGILINDTLATQVPGVYAIGECTEHAGVTYGLVAPDGSKPRSSPGCSRGRAQRSAIAAPSSTRASK